MASSPVRELITRIKFKLDTTSLKNAEKAIGKLKQELDRISNTTIRIHINANTGPALHALQQIRSELLSLNHATANVHVNSTTHSIMSATHNAGNANTGTPSQANHQNGTGKMQALADNGASIAAAGVGLASTFALPAEQAMEFEAALSSIQAKIGESKEGMQDIAKEAKRLGNETKYSATEVLQAADYLAMAGWKKEQIKAGLGDMLQLAIAGNMDLARTADIVSDGMTAMNMDATTDQVQRFNDVMASVAANSNTSIGAMGETFKYLLPLAGPLGYSIEDVGLAIELMADKGMKGERAGTSMVAVLNGLSKPTKEASETIAQLGVEMYNADGTAKPLRNLIEQLRRSFAGLTKEEQNNAAASIAGVDGMKGLLDIVTATDDRYKQFVATMDNANGATKRMSAIMHDNTKGSVEDLRSQIQGLELELGAALLPIIKKVVGGISALLKPITEFAEVHPQITAAIMTIVGAVGAFLAVFGTIGILLGGITTAVTTLGPIFTAIWGGITTAAGFLLPVLSAIGTAIAGLGAATIGWIVVAIAAIVGIIAYWDELKAFVIDTGKAIIKAVESAAKAMTSAFDTAIETVKGFFSDLRDHALSIIGEIADAIGTWLGEKIAWAKSAITNLKSFASGVIEGISFGGGSTDNRSYVQNNEFNGYSAGGVATILNDSSTHFYR